MRNNSWAEWVARVAGPGFTLCGPAMEATFIMQGCLATVDSGQDSVSSGGLRTRWAGQVTCLGTLRLATPSAALLMDTLCPQGKVIAIDWHLSIPGREP